MNDNMQFSFKLCMEKITSLMESAISHQNVFSYINEIFFSDMLLIEFPFICIQIFSNLFYLQFYFWNSATLGLGCMSWSPLACGVLSGKYDDGIPIYSRAAIKV